VFFIVLVVLKDILISVFLNNFVNVLVSGPCDIKLVCLNIRCAVSRKRPHYDDTELVCLKICCVDGKNKKSHCDTQQEADNKDMPVKGVQFILK
jgi:hypothetical protein